MEIFRQLNEKRKIELENKTKRYNAFNHVLSILTSMFNYKIGNNVPFYVDKWLLLYAMVCSFDDSGVIRILPCSPLGNVNEYGLFDEYLIYYPNGNTINKKSSEIVVGYNTRDMLPNFDIDEFADLFTDIKITTWFTLIYSRIMKLPIVKDSKEKDMVENALKTLLNGKFTSISLKRDIDMLLTDKEALETLDLTSPELCENLQYLSKFYDDKLSEFLTKYGHPINFGGKMAQMTVDEISGYNSYSTIIPLEMYECRKKFIDETNAKFNTDYTVEFSKAWSHLNDNNVSMDIVEGGGENDN